MKNSVDIKKMVKKILRRQKGLRDHQMIHPRREWMIGFLAGVAVLLAGGTWSYLTYQEIAARDIDTVTVSEVQQTGYRGELINSALSNFESRVTDYRALLESANAMLPETLETEDVSEPEPTTETPVPVTPPADDPPVAEESTPVGPPVAPPDIEVGL
jgi:hypothetical protein